MAAINTFELREQIEHNKLELRKSIDYKIKTERNNIKLQRDHLVHVMNSKIREMRLSVDKAVITLNANNPRNILNKGYSLVTKDGQVVGEAAKIAIGEIYTVTMTDGSFEAEAIGKTQITMNIKR